MLRAPFRPNTTYELHQHVLWEIQNHGPLCDLNYIDVSQLTSLQSIFMNTEFNGDISKWDVFNVANMSGLFLGSAFNGDISKWRPVSLKEAYEMFRDCPFEGDLSAWELPNLDGHSDMVPVPFAGNLPNWRTAQRCTSYWTTFQLRDIERFRTHLTQWTDNNKALYPAISLAELLTNGLASEMAHASPDLVHFCQRYRTVESLLMGMALDDGQAVLDTAAACMRSTCATEDVYSLPLEVEGI